METKSKYYIIGIMFLCVLVLLFLLLMSINTFMNEYDNCKDDFRVIEQCGCLPHEGNYEYFEKYVKLDSKTYDIGEIE